MRSVIPTITETDLAGFNAKLKLLRGFSQSIHLDLSDGSFAPPLLDYREIYEDVFKPGGISVHLMFRSPEEAVDYFLGLDYKPELIILQAESSNLEESLSFIKSARLKTGICLLQESAPADYVKVIEDVDLVQIFAGNLGHQGGEADLSLVGKIDKIKKINPSVQIAWDGGVNSSNIAKLKSLGVDIFNVGAAISRADDPEKSYMELCGLI
jgi:pentose-5-phosphate-3-epimerase